MSANIIPTHQIEEYNSTLELLSQQRDSRLRGTTREMTAKGSQMSPVSQVGVIEMSAVTSRFAPIVRTDAPTARRWVSPEDWDLAQQVDSFDELRTGMSHDGILTQAAAAAAGRRYDETILTAFFGAANTGTRGGTSTTFPSGQQIAVNYKAATDVGLTAAKLINGYRLMMTNNVDVKTDTVYCAGNAIQLAKLFDETKIISGDYNTAKPLADDNGMVTKWHGINFIHLEGVNVDSNSDVRVPLWAKSKVVFCTWNGYYSKASIRDDLSSQPWQLYTKITIGSSRLEEVGVVELICDPTA